MTNGTDCCYNQTLAICIATTHFDWMGLICCINKLLHEENYFLIVSSPGMKICLM